MTRNIKITAFWDIMAHSLIGANVPKGTCRIFRVEDSFSAVKKDAAVSSKMLVSIYKTNAYIW
jgi:hypothetical protein